MDTDDIAKHDDPDKGQTTKGTKRPRAWRMPVVDSLGELYWVHDWNDTKLGRRCKDFETGEPPILSLPPQSVPSPKPEFRRMNAVFFEL